MFFNALLFDKFTKKIEKYESTAGNFIQHVKFYYIIINVFIVFKNNYITIDTLPEIKNYITIYINTYLTIKINDNLCQIC